MQLINRDIYRAYRKDGGELLFSLFISIVKEFNNKLADALVEKGYRFKISELGTLRIRRRKRRGTLHIDYNETRKRKKEILARGGTPFEVLERDKEGKISKTNGGEEYLVSFHSSHYFACMIGREGRVVINGNAYKFLASRGNKKKSLREKMSSYLTENSLAELMYIQ